MNVKEIIISDLTHGWGRYERIIFPLELLLIIVLSFAVNDSKVALVSAVCGISYSILAGKGKVSCYFIGIFGTFCYAYISFKNQLYGNLLLYLLYCFPMQLVGIYKWKSHLKQNVAEIIKVKLSVKERIICFTSAIVLCILTYFILLNNNDQSPFFDSVTTVLSVYALFLTVKRCIEQWYLWAVVNFLSVIMWIHAYINGSNCLATVIMWATYFVLGLYFIRQWKKETDLID